MEEKKVKDIGRLYMFVKPLIYTSFYVKTSNNEVGVSKEDCLPEDYKKILFLISNLFLFNEFSVLVS
jgi:hypothetical protein